MHLSYKIFKGFFKVYYCNYLVIIIPLNLWWVVISQRIWGILNNYYSQVYVQI